MPRPSWLLLRFFESTDSPRPCARCLSVGRTERVVWMTAVPSPDFNTLPSMPQRRTTLGLLGLRSASRRSVRHPRDSPSAASGHHRRARTTLPGRHLSGRASAPPRLPFCPSPPQPCRVWRLRQAALYTPAEGAANELIPNCHDAPASQGFRRHWRLHDVSPSADGSPSRDVVP